MAERLMWIDTKNLDPYQNLAMEEVMTRHVPAGTVVLFLWQNRRTVVIGRNQDPCRECRAELLEREGGFLARRLSGGGAVFHDLGNLNFTFIARGADYDVDRQLEVILQAVKSAGIPAEKTGRNDLTAEGRKFSGNAFYRSGDCRYHHGTLMLAVDTEMVERYLCVSRAKLASKGVASVRSRVGNLTDFAPGLTLEQLKESLIAAFREVYGLPTECFDETGLNTAEVAQSRKQFASWEWKYGRRIPCTWETSHRFPWGEVCIRLQVNEGRIRDAAVFTDAMDHAFAAELAASLTGCRFESREMARAVERVSALASEEEMRADIVRLLTEDRSSPDRPI